MPAARRARLRGVVLSLGLLAGCGDSAPEAPSGPELRIGILRPLSGPRGATSGTLIMAGARMAADEVNRAGGLAVGGRRVQVVLIPQDTRDTEEGAVSAARALINHERVSAIVGPGMSVQAIGVAALAEGSRIPMVTPSATHPLVTRGRRYSFRVSLMDSVQGEVLARFAVQGLRARRVAILFDVADPYNRGLAEAIRTRFTALGGEVVAYETYTTDAASDFRPQLARIRDSGAEVLVLPNYTSDARLQMCQAREVGFTGMFLGTDAWENTIGIEQEPAAEGAYYPRKWFPQALGERSASFRERYVALHGGEPAMTAASTYDAVSVIMEAARAAGSTDPEAIRGGLAGLRGYTGVTGNLTFSGTGDPIKGLVIARIRQRRSELHWNLGPEALLALMAGDTAAAPPAAGVAPR